MEGSRMHLREWLVAQVDSGRFEGLSWEDEDRTMFRIPWKHAAKKDYSQTEDAALFKAWAVYKGKYREGRDTADPTMWKTRLRCALNKSTDFQEVPECNQLDITQPYKVYRVHYDTGSARPAGSPQIKDQVTIPAKRSLKSHDFQLQFEKESFQANKERDKTLTVDLMREHMYCEPTEKSPQNHSPTPLTFFSPSFTLSDFGMQVTLLYQGQKVRSMTSRSPDGCFILQGRVPLGNERIYGPCTAQQLSFPSPSSTSLPPGTAEAMNRLLCHLERGVLIWMAPDGVFIKRFCRGRVYWSGPMAQHANRPNKLEREKTFKLLDVDTFLRELQCCLQGKGPTPSYEIELCFGEEYPDPTIPKTKKLVMTQVVPLFAVELLQKFNLGEVEEKGPAAVVNKDGEKSHPAPERA